MDNAMNEQKFFDLFGEIDQEIIAAADRPVPFRQKRGFKVMLVAAMMAVVILATPVAGAFALAGDYRTQHPEFKGNMIEALDRALGKPDKPLSGMVTEALGVDPATLNAIFPDNGEINWNALLTVLRGEEQEQEMEDPLFRAVQIDENSMRIVAYTGKMETVIIPETIDGLPVTEIGEHVFGKDNNLQHVVIPDTVTRIEMGAFTACTNLQTVKMSENVEFIGNGAFWGCLSLTEITLPETLHTIDIWAFAFCHSLEHLDVPSSVRVLGDGAFLHSAIKEIVIPEGVTVIPEHAFANMPNLQQITLPSTVTEIKIAAFEGCESLEQITLNEGLVKIGRKAFSGTAIQSITIPSTVTDMYDIGFSQCRNLKIVMFRGNAPAIEELPTTPDSDASPYYQAPDYQVCHLLGRSGFDGEEWHGHACSLMRVVNEPIVENSTFDSIPMYTVNVLGTLDMAAGAALGEIELIKTYEEYAKIRESLFGSDASFCYEESYFEQNAVVLIKFRHAADEQVLGVAGLVLGDYSEFEQGDTENDALTLAAVVKIDSSAPTTIDMGFDTYVAVEIQKADCPEIGAGILYAINQSEDGSEGSAYYKPFHVAVLEPMPE